MNTLDALPKTKTGKDTKHVKEAKQALDKKYQEANDAFEGPKWNYREAIVDYIDEVHRALYSADRIESILLTHGFKRINNPEFFTDYASVCKRIEDAELREPSRRGLLRLDIDRDRVYRAEGKVSGIYLVLRCEDGHSPRFIFCGHFGRLGGNYQLKKPDGLEDLRVLYYEHRLIDLSDVIDRGAYNQPGIGEFTTSYWLKRTHDLTKVVSLAESLSQGLVCIAKRDIDHVSSYAITDLARALVDGKPLHVRRTHYKNTGRFCRSVENGGEPAEHFVDRIVAADAPAEVESEYVTITETHTVAKIGS